MQEQLQTLPIYDMIINSPQCTASVDFRVIEFALINEADT